MGSVSISMSGILQDQKLFDTAAGAPVLAGEVRYLKTHIGA